MTLSRLKMSPEWKHNFDKANAKLLSTHFTQFSVNSMQIISTRNTEYSFIVDVVIFLTSYSKRCGNCFTNYVFNVRWVYWKDKEIFEACPPTIYQYYDRGKFFTYKE